MTDNDAGVLLSGGLVLVGMLGFFLMGGRSMTRVERKDADRRYRDFLRGLPVSIPCAIGGHFAPVAPGYCAGFLSLRGDDLVWSLYEGSSVAERTFARGEIAVVDVGHITRRQLSTVRPDFLRVRCDYQGHILVLVVCPGDEWVLRRVLGGVLTTQHEYD